MCVKVIPMSKTAGDNIKALKKTALALSEAQIAILEALSDLEMFEHNFRNEERRKQEKNDPSPFVEIESDTDWGTGGTGTWPSKDGVTVVYADEKSNCECGGDSCAIIGCNCSCCHKEIEDTITAQETYIDGSPIPSAGWGE